MQRSDLSMLVLIGLAVILGNMIFRELEARGYLPRPKSSNESGAPLAVADVQKQTIVFADPVAQYLHETYGL